MEEITDLVKKMIEESTRKKEKAIKEAAIKGYDVLAIKTATEYETIEGGTAARQKMNIIPFGSVEEAEEILKAKGYEYYYLQPVREHMEREQAEREGKRWNMLKGID